MLAKMTSKNQITLPKAVASAFGDAEYFDVQTEAGRIILTPVRMNRADAVRSKLEALGLAESDVVAARKWARKSR